MSEELSSGTTKICPACAEDIKADAAVCRYCGQEFAIRRVGYCSQCHRQVEVDASHRCCECGSPVIDVIVSSDAANQATGPATAPPTAPPPPAPPVAPAPAPPPAGPVTAPARAGRGSGGRLAVRIVVGLVAVVVVVIGALFVGTQLNGSASSPTDLSDKFPQADVTCTKLEKIIDTNDTRALGCVSTDAHIITIYTYADRPSQSTFLDNKCAVATQSTLRSGALVMGDDFVVEIIQGSYPSDLFTPPSPRTVANRLARVLGGTVSTFNCDTRPSS